MDKKDKAFEIVKGLVRLVKEGKEVRLTSSSVQVLMGDTTLFETEREGKSWSDMLHSTIYEIQIIEDVPYIGEV